jgi:hypothetical protein
MGPCWGWALPCAAEAVRTSCSWSILKLMHVSIYGGGDACIDRVNGAGTKGVNAVPHTCDRDSAKCLSFSGHLEIFANEGP